MFVQPQHVLCVAGVVVGEVADCLFLWCTDLTSCIYVVLRNAGCSSAAFFKHARLGHCGIKVLPATDGTNTKQ